MSYPTVMARTKISNRKSKVSDKTLLDAFTTAFGSLQKQILNIQRKSLFPIELYAEAERL
jgi:hypothetical protein